MKVFDLLFLLDSSLKFLPTVRSDNAGSIKKAAVPSSSDSRLIMTERSFHDTESGQEKHESDISVVENLIFQLKNETNSADVNGDLGYNCGINIPVFPWNLSK